MGTDFVIIPDNVQYSKFKAGDTILLVQMKGVKCIVPETGAYGDHQFSAGTPGGYEFLIILSKEDLTNKITFRNNIKVVYDVLGDVQIVKVPSYYAPVVDGELTCAPWDSTSKTGGILTMIVGTRLTLNANINVKGKGFAGGAPVSSLSGLCIESDPAALDKFSYPYAGFSNSGLKGESHVYKAYISGTEEYPVFPGYAKGKGANYTGGGGGNGRFSGGGGGSLRGSGGNGGDEQLGICAAVEPGGLGGKSSRTKLPFDKIYLGGGGGGSTYLAGATPSSGGKGGGIVIILCETLNGNGHSIIADGETPGTANGNAGSGGGGAGGTIAIYLQGFSADSIIISAKGGNGGNINGTTGIIGGTGGGGGGGLINISNIVLPDSLEWSAAGGNRGTRSGNPYSAEAGETGDTLRTFVPVLNGFLFNTIKSSVTLSQIDSICSNIIPRLITGTNPVGGSGSYTYLWQKSYDIPATTSDIPLSNTRDYTPTILETGTDSVFFRRIVTDNNTLLSDISKWVGIKVQKEITGNLVGMDTTICYNQDPLNLRPLNSGPSNGNGIYSYTWIKNIDNLNWNVSPGAEGINTGESYNPPPLTDTTYYKRIVRSGRCVDYSATVTITVLPEITGNIAVSPPDSIICEGSLFNTLGASAPGGGAGSGTYNYTWQDSTISGSWLPASGTNTNPGYTPDTSRFTLINESRYLRRVVFSGVNNVCRSYSSPILLTRYHKIKDNLISADQTICEGTKPVPLNGLQPTGGAGPGSYSYSWQDSINGGTWNTLAIIPNYSPDILSVTRWYRRIVRSSVCRDISSSLLITVHPSIKSNAISLLSGLTDSTVCSGAVPYRIIGNIPPVLSGGIGIYSYKWKYLKNNSNWADTAVFTPDFKPPSLKSTTTFSRVTSSGACKDSANLVKINVLPPIINTIPADLAVCINTPSAPVVELTLSGGETGNYTFQWQDSSSVHNWQDVANGTNRDLQLPLLSTPVKYRRRVWSGPNNTCSQISNAINVSITPLPYPVFAGEDILLQSFEFLYELQASKPVLGSGKWSVSSSPGEPSFDNDTLNNTIVRNLSSGPNILTWKVINGVCELESDVSIEILDFKIPEGISPDGDGKNDILTLSGLDLSLNDISGKPNQSVELTIINSAGTKVFYASNSDGNVWKSWDGKNSDGAELPEGTYYYLLRINSNRSDKFIKRSGFIILKRY